MGSIRTSQEVARARVRAVNMAGKRTTNMGGANNAVPVMSNTRRRSSARKNKAFMMLQRDMEQVTTRGRNGILGF